MPTILCGHILSILKTLESESIDCIITSPPYWQLRDYKTEPQDFEDWKGQLGLEPSLYQYIKHLCDIFDECKRVLKKTGTCWVNLGDSYSTQSGQSRGKKYDNPTARFENIEAGSTLIKSKELPHKCLCQIPNRFAIEMCSHGWILRNEIIWHKPNAMPCSSTDRFTVDFEKLFFFTKSEKYYFEQQFEEKGRNKRTVWSINTKSYSEAHFATFPKELIYAPIKAGCPKDGIVLDIFAGSGTVAEVCLELERDFIMIELNPEYIQLINKRIEQFKDKTALFNQ